MNIIAYQKSLGPGGEPVVSWIEFEEDSIYRFETPNKEKEWATYFDKWYVQTA